MFLRWWQRRRRRRWLSQPFPSEWNEILAGNVTMWANLAEPERQQVRDYVRVFVHEKHWEGCGGMTVTDEVRVTIAAQVALLVLGFPEQYFDRVLSILIYPDTYLAPRRSALENGLVMERHDATEGEAWYRGPVILSWTEVLAGGRNEAGGSNLVVHEFAHQLDMLNGDHADGVPPLRSPDHFPRWIDVMRREHERLLRDCRHHHPTVLDCYGTTDLGEFFAVASESFLQQPVELRHDHPELYEILRVYYGQDPAAR